MMMNDDICQIHNVTYNVFSFMRIMDNPRFSLVRRIIYTDHNINAYTHSHTNNLKRYIALKNIVVCVCVFVSYGL